MARVANVQSGALKTSSGKDVSGMVQKKAYELYVKRGKRAGHAIDDWLEAERLVRQKTIL
jgi:hypothetical protein